MQWHWIWERGQRGNNASWSALYGLSVTFATTHKQIGPFWCWFQGGWFCVYSRTLWVSPTNSPVRLGIFSTTSALKGILVRSSEALFPCIETWSVSLPSCSFQSISTHCTIHCLARSPLCPAAHLHPSYQSGWMFFFKSLVVGLHYRSIFCQLWLLFLLKFVVILLLDVWGGTVCLPMPPCWPEISFSSIQFSLTQVLNHSV